MGSTEELWRRSGIALGKWWKWVLVVALAFSAALIPGLLQLEFATGQDSYLNRDSQIALDNVSFQDQFGGETVILLFSADDGSDISDLFVGENLAELERITEELSEVSEAASVITPLVSIEFSDALIRGPGRTALISASQRDPDPAGQAARTADLGVGLARLGEIPTEEQSLDNPKWVELLLFANDGFVADAGSIAAPSDADRAIRASLASTFPNHQTAVGGVVLQGNASLDQQSAGTEAVLAVMETVELDGFTVTTTGSPVYLKEVNDYLKGGMVTLGLVALAVMAVVLLVMFRVRWRLLPLLAVVFGILWSFAILGYASIDLSLVTISGLPILIGLGIDFAIQVHNRVEEEVVMDREVHPIAETLANLGPALVAAAVAAIVAFLALRISQVPMIRDFGVMLALGVGALLIAGIIVSTAVLGIREWTERTATRGESIVERIVVRLGKLPPTLGPVLVVVAILVFVVGAFAEREVTIESDPIRWIDQSSQAVTDVDRLTDETGFATTLGILVEANNVHAPEIDALLWDFTLAAEERPEVISTSSLVNTMAKIIQVSGASPLVPLPEEMMAAAEAMPPAIARALLAPDGTATQVNLRIAEASLEERAVLVGELQEDLDQRIANLVVPADNVLLVGLDGDGSNAVRVVPSGLAMVGIGLLDNLSANRTILTYLGLALVALWLLLRYRSLVRAGLAMVPVVLAVGVSAIIVGAFDLTLSPLTTVGGPLVIATCTEFSVLILARYLEERQHGLDARAATDMASARTGRAFFTSAVTTIGGFAVLIVSPLPLLRDFGIIVTMNVAVALLAALVVLPPLLVWADDKNLLSVGQSGTAVRLAAADKRSIISSAVGAVALVVAAVLLFAAADKTEGSAQPSPYTAVALPTATPLPTPTPAPTPTPVPTPEAGAEPTPIAEVDVSQYSSERPDGLVGGVLFDLLTAQDVDPQRAVCTAEVLLSGTTEGDLLAAGIATFEEAAVVPVIAAGLECGIEQAVIDEILAEARAG